MRTQTKRGWVLLNSTSPHIHLFHVYNHTDQYIITPTDTHSAYILHELFEGNYGSPSLIHIIQGPSKFEDDVHSKKYGACNGNFISYGIKYDIIIITFIGFGIRHSQEMLILIKVTYTVRLLLFLPLCTWEMDFTFMIIGSLCANIAFPFAAICAHMMPKVGGGPCPNVLDMLLHTSHWDGAVIESGILDRAITAKGADLTWCQFEREEYPVQLKWLYTWTIKSQYGQARSFQ